MGGCGSRWNAAKAQLGAGNNAAGLKKGKKNAQKAKTKENVKPIVLTEKVIQEYIDMDKEIYRYEKKNVLKKYENKTVFADNLQKQVNQLEATFKELSKQTEKEKADVDNIEQPSVKSFLKSQGTLDDRLNKEKSDYLNAVNKQEIAEKELRGAREQYERAAKIADLYKRQVDALNDLYDKQDRLLVGIFGNDYASQMENKLEAEVDDALEWQQRVSLAKFKWTNGRVLLVHALTQLAFGITRWKELKEIDSSNLRMRYFAAAEARNNFIAAGQNVQSCRVYLGRVKFPYATEEEMNEMEKATHTAFSDIQSDEAIQKALVVYQNTHKKVANLIQWFDKVITETILRDLDRANTDVSKKQKQLREERLRLMKKKVKEQFGKDLDIQYDSDVHDDTDEELLALEADQVANEDLPGKDLTDILNLSQPDGRSAKPVALSKLAPIPDKDTLFGDVKQKLTELEDSRSALHKRRYQMKEKADMALQEKLKLRQQKGRRTRGQRRKSVIVPMDTVAESEEETPKSRTIKFADSGNTNSIDKPPKEVKTKKVEIENLEEKSPQENPEENSAVEVEEANGA